jgi:hypothetical protein
VLTRLAAHYARCSLCLLTPQSRLRQKQLRAAEQPGEPDISVTRVEENIEGVAQLNSDKSFSRHTEKRLELRTVEGEIDVDVVMSGRERLMLEAIGEKRQANISIKIVSRISLHS